MRFIILPIFIFIYISSSSQEYTYTHYDIKDGLAGSTTYCIQQDKKGFIWIGAETGLSRFDGTNFVNYGIDQGLPDNEVLNIFCDSQDRLWLSLFRTEICYVQDGKVHNRHNDTLLKKIHLQGIAWQVCEDKTGDILIREDKILHLITRDGKITEFYSLNKNTPVFFSAISQSVDGNFLVLENDEVYELDKTGKAILIKKVYTNSSYMRLAVLSPQFIVWHSTNKTYRAYSFHLKKEIIFKNPSTLINVQTLRDSFICINTISGCNIRNFYTNKVDSILPKESISSVFKDDENNLWFTTLGNGIFKLNSIEFKTLALTRNNGNRLSIFSLINYKNKILAGADGCYLFTIDEKNPENYSRNKIKYSTEVKNRIVSLQKDNDTLFVGTDDNLFKVASFKILSSVDFLNVKKLEFYNKDSLFVATKENLLLLNPHNLKIIDTMLNERIICLNFIKENLFIGTLNGLVIKNLRHHTEKRFNSGVLQTRITALEKDIDGNLWIGTYGAGVLIYKKGEIAYRFNEKNGLTSNICRCISSYKNFIWIGTDKGVNKILLTPQPHIEAKFTSNDGLASDMINTILQDSNKVFVGTSNGITFFNSEKAVSGSKCVLQITNVSSGIHILTGKEIHLKHSENNIKIDYVAISYNSNGDIKYFYKIKGSDNNWSVTTNTSVNYPSLPSGNYDFEIKAINKYGVWSKPITIPFEIQKRLWEKSWFQLLSFIVASIVIWLIIKSRIQKIRQKEIEKNNSRKQIAELKQKALKSQISPHFIFNCLNSIQQYIVDKDIEGSNNFISRFSELVRKTLDFSEKNEISIMEEFDYLNMYLLLEQERFEHNFQFKIIYSSKDELENNFIPPLILQPLVENAIKHGVMTREDFNGLIEIKAEVNSTSVLLTVKDNGPGIYHTKNLRQDKFSDHKSMGMQLVEERITAISDLSNKKAFFHVEEIDAASIYHGTLIIIQIPIL
ncbi:MAG: two-component regulator propeller domain-containing protein [Parafilimonas sp.]